MPNPANPTRTINYLGFFFYMKDQPPLEGVVNKLKKTQELELLLSLYNPYDQTSDRYEHIEHISSASNNNQMYCIWSLINLEITLLNWVYLLLPGTLFFITIRYQGVSCYKFRFVFFFCSTYKLLSAFDFSHCLLV